MALRLWTLSLAHRTVLSGSGETGLLVRLCNENIRIPVTGAYAREIPENLIER